MEHTLLIKDWPYSFLSLWFPRCCVACGRSLAEREECICTMCNINPPHTDHHLRKDNPVEKLFWGKLPLERATLFFFCRKGSDFRQVLHQLEYGEQKEIGTIMERYMVSELQASDFFRGVDVIIPTPLHKKKRQIRGYNQGEWVSHGITTVAGIPVDTETIIHWKDTETQTQKSALERWENVDEIFELHCLEHLAEEHILIVDDMLTTGAATVAYTSQLAEIEGIRISVLTLTMAK